jgi:hypothetical protein
VVKDRYLCLLFGDKLTIQVNRQSHTNCSFSLKTRQSVFVPVAIAEPDDTIL